MTAIFTRIVYYATAPLLWALHATHACSALFMLRGFERVRWDLGRFGAWIRFQSTVRNVPAYRAFVHGAGVRASRVASLSEIPVTDKANYVQAYPLETRCANGRLPTRGIMIDESSGSSGQPTNWIRGEHERRANGRTIKLGLRSRLGTEPLFFINAFALGPWATGINLTVCLASWTRVKSLGPDVAKIENAIRHFGTGHHYVILGYPPFLKQLVDRAGIDWSRYHVSFIYGGESMSESMRRYLQEHGIDRVYGSFGASDLELNIAAETDFTIALRRLLEQRPSIAKRLLRTHGVLPMIFQFNPADFFLETNADGELLVTICRPGYVAPKMRYNIHDLGHVLRFRDLARVLEEEGVDASELSVDALDLPLLFHYGRSDASVAYYGCKIAPSDVQEALFRVPVLAAAVDAFQIRTYDDEAGDKRLSISLELRHGPGPDADAWTREVFDSLASINQDFRESRRMVPPGKEPRVELYATGAGPFTGADNRIKRLYVAA